jgi:small conductance mechanosensitive channel
MLLELTLPAFLRDTGPAGTAIVRIAITLLAAWLLQRLGFLLVWRAERWVVRSAQGSEQAVQRARTLGQTARHLVTTIVAVGAFFHVLEVFGWDPRPLLVGAGILGAALAFGAQFLVRDVIAGVFILVEDQFSVGDSVEVNGQVATVEGVTLRSTRLRDWQGRLLFVPNGEMRVVINHSRGWHLAVVDLPLALNQDLGSVLDVAARIVADVNASPELQPSLKEPMRVLGIERLGTEGAVVRLAARTPPGLPGATVSRETRRLALVRLREAGLRAAGDPDLNLFSKASAPPPEPARGS